jgi:hypothetical protein
LLEVWQFPLPSQQPLGHDVASQTHAPLLHSFPVAQAVQFAPFVPHCEFVGGLTQDVPTQQPLGQSLELQYAWHEPFVHWVPVLHATQAAPPEPHSELVGELTQIAPLQQPLGHELALQTQEPLTHCCPVPHATHPAPSVPH